MRRAESWSRLLVLAGLVLMWIGAIDPLEGSILVLAAAGLVALGAQLGKSRQRALLGWSFLRVTAGVAALWGLSAAGGFGGASGRSDWWGLALLPYPIGWVMGLIGAMGKLREDARAHAQSSAG